jgi:hypothetical protein
MFDDTFPAPGPQGSLRNPGPFGIDTLSSTFLGTNPNGTWKISFFDDRAGDTGTVNSWTLQITAFDPVTNLNNTGPGSLPDRVANAAPGDVVPFSLDLSGTIQLDSELVVNKNLALVDFDKGEKIKISGNDTNRVIRTDGPITFNLINVDLVDGNSGTDPGGALLINSNAFLFRVNVSSSSAGNGGGIAHLGGSFFIIESVVSGNLASGNGGGLAVMNDVPGTVTIANSTISGNQAVEGGGIYSDSPGLVRFENSTISSNTATSGAGVAKADDGAVSFINSTVASNSATGTGGGIKVTGGSIILNHTIVADNNSVGSGPNISGGGVTSQGNNLIENSTGTSITPVAGDQFGTAGSPIDAVLGPLQWNGGPTRTHNLNSGSPAINGGVTNVPFQLDQRLLERLVADAVRDIGAVEAFQQIPTRLTFTRIEPTENQEELAFIAQLLTDTGTPVPRKDISFRFSGDIDGEGKLSQTDVDGFAKVVRRGAIGPVMGDLSDSAQYVDSDDILQFRVRYGSILPRGDSPVGDECTYVIFRSEQSFAANGGTGSFNVTTFPQNCNWTAVSSVPWIEINAGSDGTGDGVVNYNVSANTNPTIRTGTITVAGLDFTLLQGAAFTDLAESNPFYDFIGKLSSRGVTLGCGGGNYCPEQNVTREQMAAFIIRALGDFDPPEPAMQRFVDVPPSNPFYRFIDQMAVRGITLGCGPNLYCPSDNVTREQMAAFLIRALGEPNPPMPRAQRFTDVPLLNPFYNFIDRLAVKRVTLGCGPNIYCPSSFVTREQMAAFLVRAFSL